MFTPDDRERVRERVLELARADERIVAGALTGSTAVGMDRWSDVDVAFAVADEADAEAIVDEWTALLDRELGVTHHWDLRRGALLYRVFLFQTVEGGVLRQRAPRPCARTRLHPTR